MPWLQRRRRGCDGAVDCTVIQPIKSVEDDSPYIGTVVRISPLSSVRAGVLIILQGTVVILSQNGVTAALNKSLIIFSPNLRTTTYLFAHPRPGSADVEHGFG